jgi:hypothetical protein
MRRRLPGPAVRAALCVLLLPALAGCADKAVGGTRAERRYYVATDLRRFVLTVDERPPETELRDDLSGRLNLEAFWPTSCCLGIQEEFDQAGFQIAHSAVFERPGHSEDPIDTRPGWEVLVSSAVLFLSEDGADRAMETWVDHYRAPVLDPVDVPGLGDRAVGLAGSPTAPAERMYLFVWRRGRLVLSLRASTGAGTVPLETVRRLVALMDARAA